MDINIQNVKIELIQWLASLEDVSLIQEISTLRKNQSKIKQVVISNSERKSIDRGIDDANNNRMQPHSEAQKVYEEWL